MRHPRHAYFAMSVRSHLVQEDAMHRILLIPLPAGSRGYKGEATMAVVSRQALVLDCRSDMVIGRLTMIRHALVSGANACCGRFLAALHESRRKQSAIERARYRHL